MLSSFHSTLLSRTALPAASLEAESDGRAALADTLAGGAEAVEAGLVRRERSAALGSALEALDEPSRQMVLLRHFGQMTFKEIAEVFSCPIGTVLAKVHRAMKVLRATLETDDESQ